MRREEWGDERVLERPDVMAAMARAALPLATDKLRAIGDHRLVVSLGRSAERVLAGLEAERLAQARGLH